MLGTFGALNTLRIAWTGVQAGPAGTARWARFARLLAPTGVARARPATDHEEVLLLNIVKLRQRYKEGYSDDASAARVDVTDTAVGALHR